LTIFLILSIDPKENIDNNNHIEFKDEYIVVPSDKTQTDAISYAKSGNSYVIQGPPGTGKSQTITNLIADFVSRDKKVLFVCEKQAALNVVNNKLSESGLGDMTVFINDTIADKKNFIYSLKKTYDNCLVNNYDSSISKRRNELADNLKSYKNYIKNHSTSEISEILDVVINNPVDDVDFKVSAYSYWNLNKKVIENIYSVRENNIPIINMMNINMIGCINEIFNVYDNSKHLMQGFFTLDQCLAYCNDQISLIRKHRQLTKIVNSNVFWNEYPTDEEISQFNQASSSRIKFFKLSYYRAKNALQDKMRNDNSDIFQAINSFYSIRNASLELNDVNGLIDSRSEEQLTSFCHFAKLYNALFVDNIQHIISVKNNMDSVRKLDELFVYSFPVLNKECQQIICEIDSFEQADAIVCKNHLNNLSFGGLCGDRLQKCISDFESDYAEFIDINAKYLMNEFYNRNKNLLMNADHENGRKVIEHESAKKRSHKSIIEMLYDDSTYGLVRELKPVWLMSVDAVAENIETDYESFDVVIFDEASQIRLEDCATSAYKAKQMIIVGDEQQLAPTSFFTKKVVLDDDLMVGADGSQVNLNLFSDNLLEQSNSNMPSVMLKYHYRSQNESLIGFSNDNFYNGELVTIPSKNMSDGISFHYMEDGIYEDRKNNCEARYIANQLRNHLMSESKDSVGIVAFSESQQKEIQKEVNILCVTDADFAVRYEQEINREEEALFIKNLENVQGDERDMMIISICYGHNEEGNMRMSFGPVNQSGGGKRLNVVFSRSKKHMMIVSSIKHYDIDSTNQGALLLKEFLCYAEQVSCKSIVKNKGVGNDVFNIDLAIHSDDDSYNVGIIVDKLNYHSEDHIVENLFLKSKTLSSFGWRIKVVSVYDWIKNPQKVCEEIHKEALLAV
jgi:DNA polymerase III delta prime subunit